MFNFFKKILILFSIFSQTFIFSEVQKTKLFDSYNSIEKLPLIIVTDPGEDVDDTFALILAATSEKFSLKAVISANEDLKDGIGLISCYAKKILLALKREDVKIFQGESLNNHRFLCSEDLKKIDIHKQDTNYLDAVKNLFETYPKVYILGIGAMTSIAKIVSAPWFDRTKCSIYQMGGVFFNDRAEYNIACDVFSSQKVLESNLDIHLITADTTFQEPMHLTQESQILKQITFLAKKNIKIFQLLLNNYNAFKEAFKKRGYFPYLSDALAFSAMEENFVNFSSKRIKVDSLGRTFLLDSNSKDGQDVKISETKVDTEGFIKYLQDRLNLLKE